MVTKRKRTSEPNNQGGAPVQPDRAPQVESVPADQPVQHTTPAPTPRKRTDAPAKTTRSLPSKKAVQAAAPEPTVAPVVKPTFVAPPETTSEEGASKRVPQFRRATRPVSVPTIDGPASEDDELVEDASEATPSNSRSAKKHKRRWPFMVVGAIVVALVLLIAALSWDRWLRYDDAAEFQGEWQTQGSTATVVIDGEQLKLTSDVAYSYTLDTGAKTISYTFGNWTGEGRYRFSLDRSQLVIFDDDSSTWFTTLTDDLGWMFNQFISSLQGQTPEEVQANETTTVLDRLSYDTAATPQEGTAVVAEETQAPVTDTSDTPESSSTTADQSEVDETQEPTSTPEVVESEESSNPQGDADPGTPATPGGLFDVNDVAA